MRFTALLALAGVACSGSSSSVTPKKTVATMEKQPAKGLCSDADICHEQGVKLLVEGGDEQFAQAAKRFEWSCERKHAASCMKRAYIDQRGLLGGAIDDAVKWFRQGCELGYGGGCGAVVVMQQTTNGDPTEWLTLLRRGCELESGRTCLMLDLFATDGKEKKEAVRRGIELLESQCATKGLSCAHLGEAYLTGFGVDKDLVKARDRFKSGCDFDNAEACYLLGQFYVSGMEVEQSTEQASLLFEKACKNGSSDGCTMRGTLAMTNEDKERAVPFLERGCKLGDGLGCAKLAAHKYAGDATRTRELHERACQVRHAPGCLWAGNAYLTGTGVDQSYERALPFFEEGCITLGRVCTDADCRQGISDSCNNAGTIYWQGLGVEADRKKAVERFTVSCMMGGNKDACKQAGLE